VSILNEVTNPGSVAHKHAVTMDLGIPESLIWCYFDIIYSSHSLVLQAEAAFEAGDYSRAASFYAKVVSQHIQLFGLVRIAIASCVLYAQRIAGF